MSHAVRRTPWCVIDIDLNVGRVFLQQRWLYRWSVAEGQKPWTLDQQRRFHRRVDTTIWNAWSNRAVLGVAGKSEFARRFPRGVPINLDVRWVTAGEQWKVTVKKIAPTASQTSIVYWPTRLILLDTNDFSVDTFCDSTPCTKQISVAHEFGHTIGNVPQVNGGDEYVKTSPHYGDNQSILHSGSVLRDRHFQTILTELNQMLPDTTFSVLRV